MRQNKELLLRRCADLTLLVPVGETALRFPGMISINETGTLLWDALEQDQTPESLADLLICRFQVDRTRAEADVRLFLDKLSGAGALQDD